MTLNLVVDINGRDAIPVRALCFVDDLKRLSPDLVAIAAAGESHYDGTWTLPTYHFSDGAVTRLKPSRWAYTSRKLKAISSRLKSIWGDADSWDLWREQATPTLPAGVFVWLDEFMEWYRRTRHWKVEPVAAIKGDTVEVSTKIRPPWDAADDDLSFEQQALSDSDYHMVLEGFPQAPTRPAAPEQPVGIEPAPNAGPIPGDLPRVAVGQLAVKAAWELELETKRVATAPEVMKRLQSWADEGKEPEYLIRSDRKRRCVIWRTAAGHEKDYGEEACGKAIRKWIDSRR